MHCKSQKISQYNMHLIKGLNFHNHVKLYSLIGSNKCDLLKSRCYQIVWLSYYYLKSIPNICLCLNRYKDEPLEEARPHLYKKQRNDGASPYPINDYAEFYLISRLCKTLFLRKDKITYLLLRRRPSRVRVIDKRPEDPFVSYWQIAPLVRHEEFHSWIRKARTGQWTPMSFTLNGDFQRNWLKT